MTVTPEGRYALDLNSSVYGDPYICGTPYLASKDDAEALAKDLLPIVDDAGKWQVLENAAAELAHQLACDAEGYSTAGTWEQFSGIETGDFLALITALKEGRTGQSTFTDWQSYATVTSEARQHTWGAACGSEGSCGCDPVYEENLHSNG